MARMRAIAVLTVGLMIVPVSVAHASTEPVELVAFPGSGNSGVGPIVAVGDRVIFAGDGDELWVSDGTASGTSPIVGVALGGSTGSLSRLFGAGDVAYFIGRDEALGDELWLTDGTEAGTRFVSDINDGPAGSDISRFAPFDERVVFRADDGIHGRELWITDGTDSGTMMVADAIPGADGIDPFFMREADGRLFMIGTDPDHGRELWVSDGTSAGTHLVQDINPGPEWGSVGQLLDGSDGRVYFSADDGTAGDQLWVSDGTQIGTVPLTSFEVHPDPAIGFGIGPITDFDGIVWFRGFDPDHGLEVWTTDGTVGGTQRFLDLYAGPGSGAPLRAWRAGERLYFAASNEVSLYELWVSDGTGEGTRFVKDILPGPISSGLADFAEVAGRVFFRAADTLETSPATLRERSANAELWMTTGTTVCTVRFADVLPGPDSSHPEFLTSAGGNLYFEAATEAFDSSIFVVRDIDDLRFCDIAGNVHEDNIAVIADLGVTAGCDPLGEAYCPDHSVTRGQIASFLARAFALPPASGDHFDDDTGSTHEDAINQIFEAEYTRGLGDGRYDPDGTVTRAQMASFLRRALGLDELADGPFTDVVGVHAGSVNAIAEAGISLGCDASGTVFCPADDVTRAQMASFLARALAG